MNSSTTEIFKNILPSFVQQKLEFTTIGNPELPEYVNVDERILKNGGGVFNSFLNFDMSFDSIPNLVHQYEDFAQIDFVSEAVDEIVDESIVQENMKSVVELNLDLTGLSESIKKKIFDEFDYIKKLLKFDIKADEYFRRWYVCGRLYMQPLFSKKPKEGIVGFHFVRPYHIIRLYDKENNKFYYYIDETRDMIQRISINNINDIPRQYLVSSDHMIFVPSGVTDSKNRIYISYLHRAIKPANQLKLLEDSLVVYRFTRAPERRAFYIDVGRLSTQKAEQYVKNLMDRFKTKLVYDNTTGVINQNKSIMTMLEDYWLPRMGSKGTQIETISGGGNQLSEISDLLYFKRRVWRALKIPATRADNDNAPTIDFGSTEFSRDEMKFARFCQKLRVKFSELLTQALRIHLIRKGVVTVQEWYDNFEDNIRYNWNENSYWAESKKLNLLERRMDMLDKIKDYIGKYFSDDFIEKNILNRTDEEIEAIHNEIENMKKEGKLDEDEDSESSFRSFR